MSCGISSAALHIPHIYAIFVYLLCRNKIHFFKFLSMSDKPPLPQLKIITSTRSTVQASLTRCSDWLSLSCGTVKYHQGRGNTLCWEQIQSVINISSTLKFVIPSFRLYIANFRAVPTEMVQIEYLKAEALQVHQIVRTLLVWYLFSGIGILVYSCTGCSTSKIYLCLEDNRSSFFGVSLKSETKDAWP